jgi:FkbM family methyltransferase
VTFVSHAQNFEDVILWRALQDIKCGRYIDVGAHDPFIDSVSLAFYNAGWRGVNVEPTPDFAARLRQARPDDTVIEAAVSDRAGPIPFFELSGLSSGIREVAAHHARSGHHSREILVNTIRLEHLLNLTEEDVHWLKVDVEGMEAQVLKSWGDCPKRPWILVIEATFPNTQEPTEHLWIDEVMSRGYERAFFDGLSCYFVHKEHGELAARLTAPANVFDAFVITQMHFSARPLREELDALGRRIEEERRQTREANATLGEMQQKADAASQEQIRALERLVTAEEQHRQALAAAVDHHRNAERRVGEALRTANASLVELARHEERNSHLQDRLRRAAQVADWAEERAGRLEAELKRTNEAVRSAGDRVAEAQREIFEVRTTLVRAQMERDQARAAMDELRADSEEKRDAADRLSSDLSAQIDQYRAALEQVEALISAAAAERSGRWHRIGRALGVAGHDQGWRALSSWSMWAAAQSALRSTAGHPITNESKMAMTSPTSTEVRSPYFRANSLEELLSWQDVDFVRCAYVTVLGRQPDDIGERYYADRIRRGYSKLDVLWQLRTSPEAANHDPGIAGFDRALRRARVRNWPARAFRRFVGGAPASRSSHSEAGAIVAGTPAIGHGVRNADASTQAIAAEIEALKRLVDGFGHALSGVANGQARHEKQINALSSSKGSPAGPVASRRPNRKK